MGVALTKRLCVICTKEETGEILINTKLSKHNAREVEKMNGQVVGYSEKPCKECREKMEKAFMFVIVDEQKTGADKNNPWRTGEIYGVDKDLVTKMFNADALKNGFAFIDYKLATDLGLPVKYTP